MMTTTPTRLSPPRSQSRNNINNQTKRSRNVIFTSMKYVFAFFCGAIMMRIIMFVNNNKTIHALTSNTISSSRTNDDNNQEEKEFFSPSNNNNNAKATMNPVAEATEQGLQTTTSRTASSIGSVERPTIHPYLPDKLFTIVGLESSGTTFVSKTIVEALGLSKKVHADLHEGVGRGVSTSYYSNSKYYTEVQHISIPWGSVCKDFPEGYKNNIVPVVYPYICMKNVRSMNDHLKKKPKNYKSPFNAKEMEICRKDIMNSTIEKKNEAFPGRYWLNTTSHYQWYQQRNVDVHLIIVVRDHSISNKARFDHCAQPKILEQEEKTAMNIITDTVRNYISKDFHLLEEEQEGRRKLELRSTNSTFNNGSTIDSGSGTLMSSRDGKIIMVSYEMLNRFKYSYLKLIYERLGIESSYNPEWKDGNVKYVFAQGR